VGASEQASQGCAGTECEGISVSVLLVQEDISTLSGREYEGKSNRKIEAVCGLALEVGLEPPGGKLDLEWLEGGDQFHVSLAGCARRSAEDQET